MIIGFTIVILILFILFLFSLGSMSNEVKETYLILYFTNRITTKELEKRFIENRLDMDDFEKAKEDKENALINLFKSGKISDDRLFRQFAIDNLSFVRLAELFN